MSFDSHQSQELIEHGDSHQAQGMLQRIAQRSPKVSQPKSGAGSNRRTRGHLACRGRFVFFCLANGNTHVATQRAGWDARAPYKLRAILTEGRATNPADIVWWPLRMVMTGGGAGLSRDWIPVRSRRGRCFWNKRRL